VPDTVSHMNFFKRYLFKRALLEDELANEERRKKEIFIEKSQPELLQSISNVEETKEEEIQIPPVSKTLSPNINKKPKSEIINGEEKE
jgi:hypothetical protein